MDLSSSDRDPSWSTIADWVEGRLAQAEAEQLTQEVARDEELRHQVRFVRDLLQTGRSLPLVAPPALLGQQLGQVFDRWAGRSPADPGVELIGSLIFDSRHDQLQLSVRGADSSTDVVHLVWRTPAAELVVEARPRADHVRLDGQVLARESTASPVFEATASGPGFSVSAVDGDTFGRFQLEVPATIAQLRVTNGEFSVLAAIDLSEPGAP